LSCLRRSGLSVAMPLFVTMFLVFCLSFSFHLQFSKSFCLRVFSFACCFFSHLLVVFFFFFFFQAEDGIRDFHVTGVQTCALPIYGEWNPITKSLQPFEQSFDQWLHNRVTYWLKDAEKYSTITNEDWDWTSNFLNENLPYLSSLTKPTFVMGDFKPCNCLIDKNDDGWYVSGVFDFTNSYFGDPIADLIKFLTIFIDSNELGVAKHFIQSFYDDREDPYAFKQRLKLH